MAVGKCTRLQADQHVRVQVLCQRRTLAGLHSTAAQLGHMAVKAHHRSSACTCQGRRLGARAGNRVEDAQANSRSWCMQPHT